LASTGVDILDPATGTGTYICDLIEYLDKGSLPGKYKTEIHANEIAILPYYIANLNIEYTFRQKMGYYEEFSNICFVDTLDNINSFQRTLGVAAENYVTSGDLFSMSKENKVRIDRQNDREISVIIGNPPYNANQMNENDNNKNREYLLIDKRIKDTYIKKSTAQKTKVYDMYSRFFRWASDRVDKDGIVAFITNRSFIDSRTFDGFRKSIQNEFDYCYIIDTKSDVRANPKIAGTTHNVFGIQTGVAVMFLVKIKENVDKKVQIQYFTLTDEMRKEEKLHWFADNKFRNVPFNPITPDKSSNWINLTDNDFDDFLLLQEKGNEPGLFNFTSLGVSTNRDEWVYDFSKESLRHKIQFFIGRYNSYLSKNQTTWNTDIKWSRDLKKKFSQKKKIEYSNALFKTGNYRPFSKKYFYAEKILNDILTQNHYDIFGNNLNLTNVGLCFSGKASNKNFQILAVNSIWGLDFLEKTNCLPLFRYNSEGNKIDNITDWGLKQFRAHYAVGTGLDLSANKKTATEKRTGRDLSLREITKLDIFHYTYGVLHNPAYRKKYELNLKREFPRIPFYANFWQWAAWGKELMNLHINYETVEPYNLKLVNIEPNVKKAKQQELFAQQANALTLDALSGSKPLSASADNFVPKAKLKADKTNGIIILDELSHLSGIPAEAWEYKLGIRSAMEWVLDQYKESTPSDPTIREKFNTYKFADYKETVIDLLMRVCTVSVRTVEIMKEMEKENG